MNAYIKTYEPKTEYAKSKQPVYGKHDRKRIFTYFIEYGEMDFGPFYTETQAVNFLTKQGFVMDTTEDCKLFWKPKYRGEITLKIQDHYSTI